MRRRGRAWAPRRVPRRDGICPRGLSVGTARGAASARCRGPPAARGGPCGWRPAAAAPPAMDDEEHPMGHGDIHFIRTPPRFDGALLHLVVPDCDALVRICALAYHWVRHHRWRAPTLVAPQLCCRGAISVYRDALQQLCQPGFDLALGARPPHPSLSQRDRCWCVPAQLQIFAVANGVKPKTVSHL